MNKESESEYNLLQPVSQEPAAFTKDTLIPYLSHTHTTNKCIIFSFDLKESSEDE